MGLFFTQDRDTYLMLHLFMNKTLKKHNEINNLTFDRER